MKKAKYSDDKVIKVRCTEEYKKQAQLAVADKYPSLSAFIRLKIDAEIKKFKKGEGKHE